MKKIPENNANLRVKSQKTPFEEAQLRAKKRALLAKIYAETRDVIASYEHIQRVAKTTGMSLEAVEKLAEAAIIELAETMEREFGVSA